MSTFPSYLDCRICTSVRGQDAKPAIFENELWYVRHMDPPYGIAGWMMLISQRHVGGPAHFDDREAASFGPTLRHLERVLEEVTGALRIYTAALGESYPHLHAHMVPRYAKLPGDAKAFAVFDLLRQAAAGEITVDAAEIERLSLAYAEALRKDPPPRP